MANTLDGGVGTQLRNRVDPWVAELTGEVGPDDGAGTDTPGEFGFQPGQGNTFLFAFDDAGKLVQLGRERSSSCRACRRPPAWLRLARPPMGRTSARSTSSSARAVVPSGC